MSLTVPADTNLDILNAKVRARRARIFEKDRLTRLCEQKSFPNLVAEVYPEAGIENHRQFEKKLAEDHFANVAWIPNYLGGKEHELFAWLLRHYQFENLKVIFRGFFSRRSPAEVKRFLLEVPEEFQLPVDKMLSAPSPDDFVEAIEDRAVKQAANQALDFFKKNEKTFFFEAALDSFFFTRLLKLASESSAGGNHALSVLTIDANIYLITLVLRAKFIYNSEFDEIEQFVQIGRAVRQEVLEKIHAADTITAAVDALPRRMKEAIHGKTETVEDVERQLSIYFYRKINAAYYGSGISLGVAIAYDYLKRFELENLTRLAEAFRYGLSREEMCKILIPPAE